jgi:hypothetical protein
MLSLRLIDPNDYTVHEDGQLIGRIIAAFQTPPPLTDLPDFQICHHRFYVVAPFPLWLLLE